MRNVKYSSTLAPAKGPAAGPAANWPVADYSHSNNGVLQYGLSPQQDYDKDG